MLITPAYKALQAAFHMQCADYGVSSRKYVEQVQNLSKQLNTRDILDYGCGKCMLQKGLPFPIQNYDPCMPEYDRRPRPAEVVVCTDVLEHIEPDCLGAVIADLRDVTRRLLLIEVACRPAKKTLPDGRNAHLIQERPNWWLERLMPHFELHSYQASEGHFTAILFAKDTPKDDPAREIVAGPSNA